MKLTYTQYGDYLIPNLVLSDTREYHICKYGRMRRVYLKDHHRPFTVSCCSRKTLSPFAEIDAACKTRLDIIETALMRREGVTEALKAPIRWSGCAGEMASTAGRRNRSA